MWLTGWLWLDPVIALLVAVNIVWTGWVLLHRSAQGFMDVSIPAEQVAAIEAVLARYQAQGLAFHQQNKLLALLAPMHRDVITVQN